MDMDLNEINNFFKELKQVELLDDDQRLPDVEELIESAQKIHLEYSELKALFDKYTIKKPPKVNTEAK